MKKIVALVSILVIAAAGFWIYRSRTAKQNQLTYRTDKVERSSLEVTILSTGSVMPVTRVDIKPSIAGRAEQVFVREGDRVRKNQVLVMTSTTERAALLDAARARGPESLKEWEELYRPVPILAPINGTIILRAIEPGQSFVTADAILAMSDRLSVEALVDETDIAQIQRDQTAKIVLDAYPQNEIRGRVEKIAYEAKTVSNVTTYYVVVIPDETPTFMRSGMTANVTFQISKKENILIVPTEALRQKDGRVFVFAPGVDEKTPKEINVETGLSDGKRTEIVSGLTESQPILITQANTKAESAGSNPFMPSRMGNRNRSGSGSGSGSGGGSRAPRM